MSCGIMARLCTHVAEDVQGAYTHVAGMFRVLVLPMCM